MRAWRTNPEHRAAQKLAREKFYSEYHIQVCTVDTSVELQGASKSRPLTQGSTGVPPRVISTVHRHRNDFSQDCKNGKVHHARRRRRAAQDDQCRHRHDHPQAVSQDHQAHRARQGPVLGEALPRRRQREPGFRAQQAGLPQSQDPGRRRQFRLRLLARARALGADRFRHPLRDLDLVRRHLLQQLLQERHPADQGVAPRTWTSCSTTPSAAPMRRSPSISRSRKSAAPTAAWSSSRSTRTASIACSTASTTSA